MFKQRGEHLGAVRREPVLRRNERRVFAADVQNAPQIHIREPRWKREPFLDEWIVPWLGERKLLARVCLLLPLRKKSRLALLVGVYGLYELGIGLRISA